MDIKTLTAESSVSPQILAADLRDLAQASYRPVICNRPASEAADQPGYRELARAATEQGLEIRHLRAVSGNVTDEDGTAFGQLMAELPKPVHAFCRTGMRSSPPATAVLEGHAQGSGVAGQAREDDMIGAWKWS